MEDVQPNEVRLSRKGSTFVPRVRTTRPQRTPYRGSHDSGPSKRAGWPSRPNSTTEKPPPQRFVEIHLPPECRMGAHGSHNARKRWIEDQKHHLWTNRHLFVVSFEYLDRDRSVLFTCRARRAAQDREHDSRDGTQAGPHPVTRRGATVQSFVKAHDGDIVQNNEPGSSRIGTTPRVSTRLGGCPQRVGNHSAAGLNLRSVQAVHTKPVPPHRAAVDTTPTIESTIDLILEPGPLAEEDSARWSTFRSGRVNIYLPPLNNGSRVSSSEAGTDPIPTPGQVIGPPDMHAAHSSDTSLPPPQSDISMNGTLHAHPTQGHRICRSLLDRYQQNVLDVDCLVYSRDCSTRLADEAEVPSLLPDYGSLVRGFAFAGSNLPLSLGPYDKPRRILHDDGFACVVTGHGIIDQVGTAGVLKLDRNIRSTPLPFEECVDDACILSRHGEPIIVLGHAREQNQIAFLHLGCGQVSRHIMLRRDWNAAKKPGVSAVASMKSPMKFASGGYDHRVHLWDIAQDLSSASAVELAIKHTSHIHSLLPIVDTSHKLVSVGADRDVHIYDIPAERVIQTLKMSCIPYHAHKTDTVACTLLEVSHLETQFEVRDHRVPNRATQRFGFVTEEKRGRFEKADTWSHFVVCGDRNGVVHLWDLRNASRELAHRRCFNDPVIQVVYSGPRSLACSKRNELACIDLQGE